ncbi:MAG: FAD-dependent oxidoreductase [Clostridia bacterium]|nr:FAD-dependent oxidoreductase [Clostridia bacterium]
MKAINEIIDKANYCLGCKAKPCSTKGCPLNNDIPQFIEYIKQNNYYEAYKTLSSTTVLPGICGRICPHMKQCQGSCVRGIKGNPVSIGDLEAFVYDKAKEKGYTLRKCFEDIKENDNNISNKKVAIIGGGPCGLTAAAFIAKKGIKVTIFEKYDYLGGLLMYGIPEFRLSKDIVNKTIKDILDLGIEVEYNKELGKKLSLGELEKEYDVIFLSFGGNVSTKMGVEGEELEGVYGGNELLEYNTHPDYKGKIVAVVGGGNVAMDCARTIKRLGAKEVKVIYRRAREQMPAEDKEIEDAINEGISFLYQNNIVKILGTNKVEKIELIKTELKQKDGDLRLSPVNIENSNYIINVDYIIMALGSKPDNYVAKLGVELDKWGNIKIDENYKTSKDKIYAGGDIAGVKKTVAWAAYSGRQAAKRIIEDLKQN